MSIRFSSFPAFAWNWSPYWMSHWKKAMLCSYLHLLSKYFRHSYFINFGTVVTPLISSLVILSLLLPTFDISYPLILSQYINRISILFSRYNLCLLIPLYIHTIPLKNFFVLMLSATCKFIRWKNSRKNYFVLC
jgi:hypothetical protein